nr:MAG TPA: Intracellular delivery domain [Caudoviricetes sp.]
MIGLEIEGNSVFSKLKRLEEEHKLRVICDNGISSVKGFVVESCGQYLIVVKDGLSPEALEDVFLHEGIHIDCDHLEGHSRSEAENETKSAVKKYHEGR